MNFTKTTLMAAVAALCVGMVSTNAQAQQRDFRTQTDPRVSPRTNTDPRFVVPNTRTFPQDLRTRQNLVPNQFDRFQPQLRLRPPQPPVCQTPRLGFYGTVSCRGGMRVNKVVYGSEAWRVGLEPGDVILSINNQRIRSDRDYQNALRFSDGHLDLRVLDVRGRGVTTIHAHVETCNTGLRRGPIRR